MRHSSAHFYVFSGELRWRVVSFPFFEIREQRPLWASLTGMLTIPALVHSGLAFRQTPCIYSRLIPRHHLDGLKQDTVVIIGGLDSFFFGLA